MSWKAFFLYFAEVNNDEKSTFFFVEQTDVIAEMTGYIFQKCLIDRESSSINERKTAMGQLNASSFITIPTRRFISV